MLRRVVHHCDAVSDTITADAGYFSAANVSAAEYIGTEPIISVNSHRSDGSQTPSPDEPRYRTDARLRMRAVLKRGRKIYARRKATVEAPVWADSRRPALRPVSLRGLFKTRCEWLLVRLTHNVLKLFRARQPALSAE